MIIFPSHQRGMRVRVTPHLALYRDGYRPPAMVAYAGWIGMIVDRAAISGSMNCTVEIKNTRFNYRADWLWPHTGWFRKGDRVKIKEPYPQSEHTITAVIPCQGGENTYHLSGNSMWWAASELELQPPFWIPSDSVSFSSPSGKIQTRPMSVSVIKPGEEE